MTLREALNYGKMQLKEADIEEYALDAWLLMEHITGISKAMFFVKDKEEMEISCQKRYLEAIDRRKKHIPLQHITGVQEFMGYEFYVNEHVLIPRQDTEILVEEAHRMCQIEGGRKILDLCCGSGCIILSLLKMDDRRTGIGSDISQKALVVAERNRVGLGLSKEEGEESISFFENKISDAIKQDIADFFVEKKFSLKNEVSVKSDYYRNTNGEFSVHCQVIEHGMPLIDLTVTVPSREEAETMTANWTARNQEIYAYIMTHLL